MTTPPPGTAPGAGGHAAIGASTIIGLLALAAFINYVDRGALATAGPLLRDQLGLSNRELGTLLSAFFWTYAPAQLFVGAALDRFGVRQVLAFGVLLWGVATALCGLAGSFAALLALRLALGVGESVMIPAATQLFATHVPAPLRGRASGLLTAGQAFGPAFGTLAGGLVLAVFGWRMLFVVLGIVSLLWIWPWLLATRGLPRRAASRDTGSVSTRDLLRCRPLWGMSIGHFATGYALYLVMGWLPTYLVQDRGFSITEMAGLGAAIYCVYAASSIAGGALMDRRIEAGTDAARLYRRLLIGSIAALVPCFLLAAFSGRTGALLALAGCAVCFGVLATTIIATVQVLAGPRAAGRWMGLQNLFANLAGITGPVLTGWLVDRTGSFAPGFVLAAAVCIAGALAFSVLVPEVRPVRWDRARIDA